MKASVQWLKDYVTFSLPVQKLAHQLTMAGMEVEKIDSVGKDHVLEMEITPNRPDCLNMIGIAREIGAILNKPLKIPKTRKARWPKVKTDISVLDKKGCPRYIGIVIKDVTVQPSPEWLQARLKAIGLRPINNIVDITNFCLMETGQPLHAFDYDILCDKKIIVRRARKGEKILTLDGEDKSLDEDILVIADAKRPVAVAGIMGGEATQVTAKTKNILLESAFFDFALIRRGSRALGLSSDSSYRFERGVDIPGVLSGALRALTLILELAGGSVHAFKDFFPTKHTMKPRHISVSRLQIERLLGEAITAARSKIILKRLGFHVSVKENKTLAVTPPSFRQDVRQPVDVIEEIARIYGYDTIPVTLPAVKYPQMPPDRMRQLKQRVCGILTGAGLNEVITYSLVSKDNLDKTSLGDLNTIEVMNPLSMDQSLMRPSLLPSLLACASLNLNRGQKNLRFFELGKAYFPSGEKNILGIVLCGLRRADWRDVQKDQVDFYDLKGVVSGLLNSFSGVSIRTEKDPDSSILGPDNALAYSNKKLLGSMGYVKKDILKAWDIKKNDILYAEIYLDDLLKEISPARKFQGLCEYPGITRDVSLAVNKDIPFARVKAIAQEYGKEILAKITFVEEYLGDKIADDKRGLIFSVFYRSDDRTLTENEVNEVHGAMIDAFQSQLNATIR